MRTPEKARGFKPSARMPMRADFLSLQFCSKRMLATQASLFHDVHKVICMHSLYATSLSDQLYSTSHTM